MKRLFAIGYFLLTITCSAQTDDVPKDSLHTFPNVKGVEGIIEKDIIDYAHKVMRFFTPRKFKHPIIADSTKKDSDQVYFAFLPAVGYALQTGVTGIVAINISFFTTKKYRKDTRLSSFTINPAVSLQNQVMVPIQS